MLSHHNLPHRPRIQQQLANIQRGGYVLKESVLPPSVTKRIAIEAGHADYWHKFVGLEGRVIGLKSYGESAPAGDLFKHFSFTVENVLKQAQELLDAGF